MNDVQTDAGDSQIAPEDAQDVAGSDAALADTTVDVQDVVSPDIQIDGGDVPPPDCLWIDNGPDTTDDTFQAQNCVGFGSSANCPPNLTCWTSPCPKCGMMPQGFCVPPLAGGGCYDYSTCNGGDCHNAAPMNGVAGWCLPVNKTAGQCWPNISSLLPECYPGATCEGAVICPPMADCLMADKPGACKPASEQKGGVFLWERNGGIVSPGESVVVTWVNATGSSIFLPGCSTYSIQTSPDSTTWTDKGPNVVCVWEGVAVEVPAGAYFDTQGWQAPTDSGTVGNYRFHGSYATGCTVGKPMSQAACAGSSTVDSQSFFVGYVP